MKTKFPLDAVLIFSALIFSVALRAEPGDDEAPAPQAVPSGENCPLPLRKLSEVGVPKPTGEVGGRAERLENTRRTIEQNRKEMQPLLTAAGLYEVQGKEEEARKLYEEIAAIDAVWPALRSNYASFLKGQAARALITDALPQANADIQKGLNMLDIAGGGSMGVEESYATETKAGLLVLKAKVLYQRNNAGDRTAAIAAIKGAVGAAEKLKKDHAKDIKRSERVSADLLKLSKEFPEEGPSGDKEEWEGLQRQIMDVTSKEQ